MIRTSNEHNHDEVSNMQLAEDGIRIVTQAAENICDKSSKIMRSAQAATENTEDLRSR